MQKTTIAYISAATFLFAAGAVALERWGSRGPPQQRMVQRDGDALRQTTGDVARSDELGDRWQHDKFSWDMFLTLNLPAGIDAASSEQKNDIPNDGPTAWGKWMQDLQILVPTGQVPPTWGTAPVPPSNCPQQGLARVLTHSAKAEPIVASSIQAQAGPLIDQNARYVRYEIVVNRAMYDYIVNNRLYTQAGLKAIDQIDFPAGSLNPFTTGAVMIKAAWKSLGPGDDPARFHTIEAYVVDGTQCTRQQMGLVGLHISTKTVDAPQWVWSTFEHVDNAPVANGEQHGHYSFFDPDCREKRSADACLPNALPAEPWDPTRPGQIPVQTTRVTPIDPVTAKFNASYQDKIKRINPTSVWANYMLVGTQYPQRPGDPTDRTGRPFPAYLANVVIETFMQGDTPIVSSTCIGCHNRATAAGTGKSSDFTYILSRVVAKE